MNVRYGGYQPKKKNKKSSQPPSSGSSVQRDQTDVMENATKIIKNTPTAGIIKSINFMIDALRERGADISDWDDKDKKLSHVQMIHNRIFFLAAKDNPSDKGDSTNDDGNSKRST